MGTLTDLLTQAKAGDYLALMAYVDGTPAIDSALRELRSAILTKRRLPNTLGYGPRFLHSTGQLHKGGANNGLFVQLTSDWGEDIAVPDADYSFAGLAASQVVGDYTALVSHGRRVVRIDLGRRAAASIRRLTEDVSGNQSR